MSEKKKLCCTFKPYVNEYGTHINVYLSEQTGEVPEGIPDDSPVIDGIYGEKVAKITYHVTTHSITIGKYIKEGYTEEEVALYFVSLLKEDWFREYIIETAGIAEVSKKPVWCKQSGKHYV